MAKQAADRSTKEMTLGTPCPQIENLLSGLNQIRLVAEKLQQAWDSTHFEMAELKAQGLIYAGTTYKAGKYLYLVYPYDDAGQRKREYIGADPDKIKEALAGIERARRYDMLSRSAEVMKHYVQQAVTYVGYAHQNLT